ncbi:programmed cell death protein 2 [Lentinula guzmanii]|uniref:Programmed cell death protein 2 n=1 Tax=Lentinula guzmanii TaxID=2804957 RepID=A0AA38JJ82_9AGAR|nr:programmed cell death protein 2 [Lentinula guzmanii]
MAPSVEEDWSDSDEELGSEVETSVLLGIPDGPITSVNELADAAVSRIGGHSVRVAFLPANEPPISSSQCKICSFPMELLVQMWCPFENSPMDRALYVWGCANPGCQRKNGSVRAWRGLRFNEKYAAELEAKTARKRAQEETKRQAEQAKQASKTNPFSLQMSSNPNNPFGLGTQIFGNSPSPVSGANSSINDMEKDYSSEDEESETESTNSEQSLLTAMTNTTLSESAWTAAPAYSPPLYLSTTSEYLPPQPKPKIPSSAAVSEPAAEGGKDISWAFEPYENSLEVDQVFERFTKRVGYEGEQCIRYELHGTPLPFSSDKIFESLFPIPSSDPLPVTKPDFKVILPQKRTYSPTSGMLLPCPSCRGKRIFECQLMPNLINILRDVEGKTTKKLTDEERRAAVQKNLKGGFEKGMEWGTCMIFSCENDCRIDLDGKEVKDVWREELVLVQWDV